MKADDKGLATKVLGSCFSKCSLGKAKYTGGKHPVLREAESVDAQL